jgi:hypothetical protein
MTGVYAMSNSTAQGAIVTNLAWPYRQARMPGAKGESDPEVIRFMRRVMDALDVKTAGQLADLLVREGSMNVSQTRKINRWVAGTSAPDHHATILLLERAGLLKLD